MPHNTRTRFLAAAMGAGWTHPYGTDPFVLYADGGDAGGGTGAEGAGNGPDDPKGDGGKPQGDPAGEAKPDDPKPAEGDEALGEAGKKALAEERTARKEAERKLTDLEAEVSRLRRSNAASKGTDMEAIKAEIRSEFAAGLVEAQLEAAATGRLAKPEDAVLFVGTEKIAALAKDGRPDKAAISEAIDQVLKERPYLAGQAGPQWGDVGGGHHPGPSADVEPGLGRLRHAYATETKTK
ncbi:hypothetical protein [Streptomyces sp. P9-A2]|uniref:hypothetical protein n=1 Tax=Streptomyces sp. P9-A2 TaxID=3072284 RepID=UPI002FCC634E